MKAIKLTAATVIGLFITRIGIATISTTSILHWDKNEGTILAVVDPTADTFSNHSTEL